MDLLQLRSPSPQQQPPFPGARPSAGEVQPADLTSPTSTILPSRPPHRRRLARRWQHIHHSHPLRYKPPSRYLLSDPHAGVQAFAGAAPAIETINI
ncbi:hypothetical protein M5K25_017327 [Dendrobium thyrsiflorum]|uniref:Uncharacterized protein n=1 Tax=Dendrobium thyrsiflorum TaxID=117978 RepID=A0ABD0UTV1_DENTH